MDPSFKQRKQVEYCDKIQLYFNYVTLQSLLSTYLTLSGSVTVKLRRAEQAVSMLGSLPYTTPPFPRSEVQH